MTDLERARRCVAFASDACTDRTGPEAYASIAQAHALIAIGEALTAEAVGYNIAQAVLVAAGMQA